MSNPDMLDDSHASFISPSSSSNPARSNPAASMALLQSSAATFIQTPGQQQMIPAIAQQLQNQRQLLAFTASIQQQQQSQVWGLQKVIESKFGHKTDKRFSKGFLGAWNLGNSHLRAEQREKWE